MTVVNKHTKIISAAIKVFAKKGFFTARISDIAKEAKVADGTIYIYFNNKYDILLSIFEEEIGEMKVDGTRVELEAPAEERREEAGEVETWEIEVEIGETEWDEEMGC